MADPLKFPPPNMLEVPEKRLEEDAAAPGAMLLLNKLEPEIAADVMQSPIPEREGNATKRLVMGAGPEESLMALGTVAM
jgi:hypothetical protein